MQTYVDFYGKPLKLGDKVLFANDSRIRKGVVKEVFGNIIVVKDNKYRYDFGYFDAKEGIIKLDE